MRTYLLNLWDWLRTSYWFVPSLCALGAIFMSWVLPWVDGVFDAEEIASLSWARTTTSTARSTLSAVAGAMFTVTGTVFSITIVTLSLASQQFGPRLLRRFMHDLTTQLALGVFLATSLYCLLIIRQLDAPGSSSPPHLSVAFAVGLTILSMAMLIGFIHHIASLIQAPEVVAAVAADLDAAIERLYPEQIGETLDEEPGMTGATGSEQPGQILRARQEGYIQAFVSETLLKWSVDNSLVVRLRLRPGQYVSIDYPLAEIWSEAGETWDERRLDRLGGELDATLIVGARRTPRQDVLCAIDELAEVAVRSLSPGVNDPFTAINCIDRLGSSLERLAGRRWPSPHRADADGRRRIIVETVSYAELLDGAFDQIRNYGARSIVVLVRLLDTLRRIAWRARRPEDLVALRRHADRIMQGADAHLADESDRLNDHYQAVIEAIESGDESRTPSKDRD